LPLQFAHSLADACRVSVASKNGASNARPTIAATRLTVLFRMDIKPSPQRVLRLESLHVRQTAGKTGGNTQFSSTIPTGITNILDTSEIKPQNYAD